VAEGVVQWQAFVEVAMNILVDHLWHCKLVTELSKET
jgi:hypothetical protein